MTKENVEDHQNEFPPITDSVNTSSSSASPASSTKSSAESYIRKERSDSESSLQKKTIEVVSNK